MVKSWMYVIILFMFTSISCQTSLIGKYCSSFNNGFDSTCIEFQGKDKFSYETEGDLGVYLYGNGSYIMTKNRLLLHFSEAKEEHRNKIEIQLLPMSKKNDSIQLIFIFKDSQGLLLPGVNLINHKDSSFIPQSNKKGILYFNIAKKDSEVEYQFFYPFYENIKISLIPNRSKKFFIELHPWKGESISDKTFEYDIKEKKKDYFVIENRNIIQTFKKVK